MTLTNPTIDIAGKYALLADLDGNNSLNLYDTNGNNIVNYPISTDILSAKVNKRDMRLPRLPKKVIRGTVVVFNKKADEVFKWNSGEGYITDVDISKDGKIYCRCADDERRRRDLFKDSGYEYVKRTGERHCNLRGHSLRKLILIKTAI